MSKKPEFILSANQDWMECRIPDLLYSAFSTSEMRIVSLLIEQRNNNIQDLILCLLICLRNNIVEVSISNFLLCNQWMLNAWLLILHTYWISMQSSARYNPISAYYILLKHAQFQNTIPALYLPSVNLRCIQVFLNTDFNTSLYFFSSTGHYHIGTSLCNSQESESCGSWIWKLKL